MAYLDLAQALVKRLEACKLAGYPDSGGVPTNGYGHTGPEVRLHVKITQDTADANLLRDLIKADCRLEGVCSADALAKLRQHQRAALVSFVFNVGAKPEWTIWKDIDSGNLADVPAQLRRFDKVRVGKKLEVIRGLNNRREAEVAFWNTADVEVAAALAHPATGAGLPPPSHTTVTADTPPTPEPNPPLAKVSLVAKAITLAGGATTALASQAQQFHGVISPYVDSASIFHTLDTIAIGAIVAAGVVGVLIHNHQANARKV